MEKQEYPQLLGSMLKQEVEDHNRAFAKHKFFSGLRPFQEEKTLEQGFHCSQKESKKGRKTRLVLSFFAFVE